MATKKSDSKKKGDKEKDPEKEAKRKARQEALKNRPAEQRPNSKQIDVIAINDKSKVMNFGYAVKNKEGYQGVVVTSVLVTDGKPVSTSVSFVPGTLSVAIRFGNGSGVPGVFFFVLFNVDKSAADLIVSYRLIG